MDAYLSLRMIHVTCVAIAAVGFLLRGAWMLRQSPLLNHRLTRTLPHVNDTILLGAAIAMAWIANLNPLDHAWLTAKLIGLILYILLGSIALRRGPTPKVRAQAFAGAVFCFGYVVAVAMTRNPVPFST